MTSDEMTTGSVHATDAERKWLARQTRWWNATGGGTAGKMAPGVNPTIKGIGAIKAGDGGVKFRAEWPELDEENWKWIKTNKIDPVTGQVAVDPNGTEGGACSPEAAALRRRPGGSAPALGAVVGGGQVARDAGHGWLRRNKLLLGGTILFGYVLMARLLGDQQSI